MVLHLVDLGEEGVQEINRLFDNPWYRIEKRQGGDNRVRYCETDKLLMRYNRDVFAIYLYGVNEFPQDIQDDFTRRLEQITNESVSKIIHSARRRLMGRD